MCHTIPFKEQPNFVEALTGIQDTKVLGIDSWLQLSENLVYIYKYVQANIYTSNAYTKRGRHNPG